MTRNRGSKRAIRSRMAQTGEKYTEARRAILTSGGAGGGAGEDPDVTIERPPDALGWFTDQAYNAIVLADDEARMLSRATVEPEHLLLASARRGNVASLLAANRVEAHQIHDALVRLKGFGERLELSPRRSRSSAQVLERAVLLAADRGVLGPSTEHLLLALGEQRVPMEILGELGLPDAATLVDAAYPAGRPPLERAVVQRRAAQLAATPRSAPSPGPIAPVFERFTREARAAIGSAIEYAREAGEPYVEPVHLLLGALNAGGVVAVVRAQHRWDASPARFLRPREEEATDIFTPAAREIVAEGVLVVAERLVHRPLTSGHLLIAALESGDARVREVASSLPGPGEIGSAVLGALPSAEEG